MPGPDPDRLITEGRLAEAARALEARGEAARAAELFEQIWDFAAASRAALSAGDLPRALGNSLRGKDPGSIEEVVERAVRAPPVTRAECARVCEERGAWPQAARLHEAAADLAAAARCQGRAGYWLEAARLHEARGDVRAAIEQYRRHLAGLEEEQDGAAVDDRPSRTAGPCYALGRLLLSFGRAEEALPLLQRAWQEGQTEVSACAGRATVVALHRLGYRFGATFALEILQQERGQGLLTLEGCLADPALAPAQAGDIQRRVLAGRYRLGELLGAGGMGSVYEATDLLTEERVAVKIFTTPGGARGRDAYLRFVREARATGRLRHPHIVTMLEFNEEMGFLVLEHMAGGTLAHRLHPRLDLASCRNVMLQIIDGLAAAHQRGVIHRDIKPSNIFFDAAGTAKLGDFGVAHLQDTGQTQTGAFIGTLAYMSPEQITGQPVSFATDIYALGVTLFLMLTGRLPFTPPDVVGKHLGAPVPRPSTVVSHLPGICDEVVLRCLAKQPQERYESLALLQQAVTRFPKEAAVTAAKDEDATPALPLAPRRATDTRFTVEYTVVDSGHVQVQEARDNRLGRAVMLVRIAPGPGRPPLLALLRSVAARGDEHLQRVLALDPQTGQAVLETRLGEPPGQVAGRLDALRICEDLGRALQPLHRIGLGHGGVSASAVTRFGDCMILALVPALVARSGATPPGDVQAVLQLAGLAAVQGITDGMGLAEWARAERACEETRIRRERRQRLLQEALASAPPQIRDAVQGKS